MRHDMFKVIVERPRVGGNDGQHHEVRRAKRFILDEELDVADEFCTYKSSIRPQRKERKSLNENLGPLRRFLNRQVGRPWDQVYSEICEHLDANSTVKQHVRDHLKDFVVLKVARVDGVLYGYDRFSPSKLYHGELYVDPDTRLLKKTPGHRYSWRHREKKVDPDVKVVSQYLRFVRVKGTWFKAKFVDAELSRNNVFLLFEKDVLGTPYSDYYRKYGANVKAVSKETASKREIRDYKLNVTS